MDKKEKIILGEAQDTNYDIKLMEKRLIHAKELCYKYNNLSPSETDKRNALLKDLLGKTQNNFLIEQPFICDYGNNIEIGENFYANHNCIILDVAKVIFGDNIFIAPNCSFYTVEHPLDKDERNKGIKYASPIIIGNDVWIGGNTIILPGVTIGDNVVIGAGSIVNKDIPSGVVAAGNPCRIIKEITK